MKLLTKIGAVLLVSILLISSIYVVSFMESEKPESNNSGNNGRTNDNNGNNSNNNSNNSNDNNNNSNQNFTHIVFVEEAAATWCSKCPVSSDVLYKKFNSSDKPDFCYINMVEDKNTKAHNQVFNDYNLIGYPTVFIDGGYRVIGGSIDFEKNFNEKLLEAKNRQTPKIILSLKTKWNESRKELTATVNIENKETTTYKGHIKVYVTEINSPWSDWNGNPFHFAFIDYAIDENIEIQSNKNQTITKTWDANNTGYSGVYPENLWLVAAVFNQKSTKEYSDPPQNEHQFNAYYADATTTARVEEGVLPPVIGISYPKCGMSYIFGKEKKRSFTGEFLFSKERIILLKALIQYDLGNSELYWKLYREGRLNDIAFCANIFGKITIKTNVQAEAGIEKVEFIIKGRLGQVNETVYKEPYEWTWDTFAFGRYTIVVNLYDKEGKTSTDSINVIAFINLMGLFSS